MILDTTYSFFLLTANNLLGVILSSPSAGNPCGVFQSTVFILQRGVRWTNVTAITSSPYSVWVADMSLGINQISLADGSIQLLTSDYISPDSVVTSIFWLDAWSQLFIGCSNVLLTYTYAEGGNDKILTVEHFIMLYNGLITN